MDWLLERRPAIERKVAERHLDDGGLALYDPTSSSFEGTHCALPKYGHKRDGDRGKPQVDDGLVANAAGCPVAALVFDGNVSGGKTLMPQVKRLREDFGSPAIHGFER